MVGAGAMGGSFHLVANKAFARYLPDPTALMEDAYRTRCLPSLLLGGCVGAYLPGCCGFCWYRGVGVSLARTMSIDPFTYTHPHTTMTKTASSTRPTAPPGSTPWSRPSSQSRPRCPPWGPTASPPCRARSRRTTQTSSRWLGREWVGLCMCMIPTTTLHNTTGLRPLRRHEAGDGPLRARRHHRGGARAGGPRVPRA